MSRTFLLNPKVADKVHAEYCWVLDELKRDGSAETLYLTSTSPSKEHFRSLIEETFWASLQRVEGRHHRFCIAFCPEDSIDDPFLFKKAVSFDSEHLAKLSPALQAERIVIGVWPVMDNLKIWGFWPAQMSDSSWSRRIDAPHRLLVKVVDAGQILFEFDAFPHSAYVRTLFTGTQAEDIELNADPLLNALYWAAGSTPEELDRLSKFREIAINMRSHGHGGALLIVPPNDENWRESVDCGGNEIEPYNRPRESRVTESIAQLTAIDGATIVTHDLTVLGFGGKIHPRTDPTHSEAKPLKLEDEVLVSTPFKQHASVPKRVSELNWGTRHLSAAQFVLDQKKGSMAIVASQDGRLSIFEWVTHKDNETVGVTLQAEFALL
ncbi:MAG: putative sensor domain DACNV-containing protein [Acidobacteriota bacterium]